MWQVKELTKIIFGMRGLGFVEHPRNLGPQRALMGQQHSGEKLMGRLGMGPGLSTWDMLG